ncbi:MAG: hypothetical protein PVJ43_13005 [Gemmatimonadales bacterium]|jgi:hypothetical protein
MRSSTDKTRLLGGGLLRRSIAFAVALVLVSPASSLAQSKSYKRWYLGIGGALAIGIPAYVFTSEEGTLSSTCSSKGCVGGVAAAIGGIIGFLVGLELDKSYERRMRAGPTFDYSFQDVPLDIVPDRITGFPGGAAIVGMGGARVVRSDGTIRSRGSGVRGIEDVAVVADLDLLILSTFSNLLSFEMANDSAYGRVIDERGGGSMEVFDSRLAVAGLDSLRLLDISRVEDDVRIETVAGLESSDYVTDMAFDADRNIGWVLTENRLVSYEAGLRKIGEVTLPATGRSVRAQGDRLVVAAGSSGALVFDARDPTAPRIVQQYEGVRFAYAADLDGERMYVAAGPEGVALVDISGDEPRVVGVAREPRFATDVVVSEAGVAWILDRDGKSVQIADFRVGGAEAPDTGK